MKWFIPAAVLTMTAAAYLARRNAAGAVAAGEPTDPTEPDQLPTLLEEVTVTLSPSTYDTGSTSQAQAATNERAFLDMISYSEGTTGPNGYAAMFGYPRADRVAQSLDDHPRQYFSFTNGRGEVLRTSAAGRYQFLVKTWDALRDKLSLPDFGPKSQDSAALELIRQRGALADVRAGRTEQAIAKCAPIWASLPGAGYAQPERKLSTLLAQYRGAGGSTEAIA